MAQPSGPLGGLYFVQGHLDMQIGGAGDRPTDLPINGHSALPFEPRSLKKWDLCILPYAILTETDILVIVVNISPVVGLPF